MGRVEGSLCIVWQRQRQNVGWCLAKVAVFQGTLEGTSPVEISRVGMVASNEEEQRQILPFQRLRMTPFAGQVAKVSAKHTLGLP